MSDYNLGLVTILIVEDNTYIRNLLRPIMTRLGAGHVLTAAHGGEAIDLLKLIRSDRPRPASAISTSSCQIGKCRLWTA